MQNAEQNINTPISSMKNFRGLGGWNFYFILKFALLYYGYLNFHPLQNLIFLALLLFPLPSEFLHKIRNWIAVPIGFGLFYHDTWLPGIYSIITEGSGVLGFSGSYILELLNRFINWNMIGVAIVLYVAYNFLSQWIRFTTITIITLSWINLASIINPLLMHNEAQTAGNKVETKQIIASTGTNENSSLNASANLPPTNVNLNNFLNNFYNQQSSLRTSFPSKLADDAVPFDILFIQICSLAWSDIDAVNLQTHPIWGKFDLLFTEFNSAASYSGPAAIRLLRMSCGQTPHSQLYNATDPACYIMDNLANLGFTSILMLDHKGIYGDFLKEVQSLGGLEQTPLMSQEGLSSDLIAFDGGPVYNDLEVLNRWLNERKASPNKRSATYFNLIPLHDGDRTLNDNQPAPYKQTAKSLLDNLDIFFDELNKSGRKALVVFIPEHGRNLTGDKLQMPGLRDIPSFDITHVPVAIKFFGMNSPNQNGTLKIDEQTSYLAISDLIARVVNGSIFNQTPLNLQTLTQNLPKTDAISENNGIIVMDYQNKPYILLKGETNWVPYP